jgi:rsbT co-antagonist protein RsbR
MPSATTALDRALADEHGLLNEWTQLQLAARTLRPDLLTEAELLSQSREFVSLFREAIRTGNAFSPTSRDWYATRDFLGDISRSRALQGFSPSETATFVFSLKEPLFARLRRQLESTPVELAEALWIATETLDSLALHTTELFQRSREEIIRRQQQELLELSTPVVELWSGILAPPSSARSTARALRW